MTDPDSLVGGVCCALLGVALLYWRGKRIFARSNQYGTEIFPSFFRRLSAKSADFVLFCLGGGLLINAYVLICYAYLETWGSVALLPLLPFALIALVSTIGLW